MISKKTIWIVVLSVCIITPAYLYYVKKDREATVKNYSANPTVGDIYILQKETPEDGTYVYYLKVSAIEDQTVHFIRSKMTAGAPYDVLLQQFDAAKKEQYTKTELLEIAAGKWMNADKENTKLIEIKRK